MLRRKECRILWQLKASGRRGQAEGKSRWKLTLRLSGRRQGQRDQQCLKGEHGDSEKDKAIQPLPRRIFSVFSLYWSMVNWQYWVHFRYTVKWFNYTYTCIYSFPYSFPRKAITECWAVPRSLLMVSCIYSSVCALIPPSLFIPPRPTFPLCNPKFVF